MSILLEGIGKCHILEFVYSDDGADLYLFLDRAPSGLLLLFFSSLSLPSDVK